MKIPRCFEDHRQEYDRIRREYIMQIPRSFEEHKQKHGRMCKEYAMKTIYPQYSSSLANIRTPSSFPQQQYQSAYLYPLHLRKHTAILEKVAAYPFGVRKCQVMK